MDPSTGRPAGDQRITPEGREILLGLVTGDLMDEFQAELDIVQDLTALTQGPINVVA